jgi:enediyne biosynthesis protein E3
MAAGAAVAATSRMQTGGVAEQTDLACEALCGLTSAQVAEIGNAEREGLPPDGAEPAYEIWRQRLAQRFSIWSFENATETKEASA